MTRSDIIVSIEQIVRDELDDDSIVLHAATSASDVDGWDSLAHVRIVVAIEQAFNTRFSVGDITEIRDVGGLVSMVERAVAPRP